MSNQLKTIALIEGRLLFWYGWKRSESNWWRILNSRRIWSIRYLGVAGSSRKGKGSWHGCVEGIEDRFLGTVDCLV